MDVFKPADVFYFPQFTSSKVLRKNGTAAEAKLNYNRLVDEMHFISDKGDTLALANEKTIDYVAAGTDTFYYDEGYLRLLAVGAVLKLAVKQIWVISDSRQLGAYNSTNSSVSILSYTSYQEGGRLYDLTVNADLVLKRLEYYYLGNSQGHFVPAAKKELLTLFSKGQEQVENFLDENKINFSKEEDLKKLVRLLKPM